MISYSKKQKYLQETEELIHALSIASAEQNNVDEVLAQIQSIRSYIVEQDDITLEKKSSDLIELKMEDSPEFVIKQELEKIKARIPVKYHEITKARIRCEEKLPDWIKQAFFEHVDWEFLCLQETEALLQQDVRKLVEKIPAIFTYLPYSEKQADSMLCQEAVKKDIRLLKYVPITVIEKDINFWKPYFGVMGIDIELFQQYDKKIHKNITISENIPQTKEEQALSFQDVNRKFLEEYFKKQEKSETAKTEEKKEPDDLSPEKIQQYMEEGRIYLLPEDIKLANPKWCMEQVRSGDIFDYVPESIKLENPEWCMSLVENEVMTSYHLPKQIKLDHQDWCQEISEEKGVYTGFMGVPDEIKIANPDWCIQLVEKRGLESDTFYSQVPDVVKLTHPGWAIRYFKQNLERLSSK